MLNCAIDLPKILGNFEHRQEYISRILQQDDFTQYAFPCLHQLQQKLAQKPHMAQYPHGSRDEAHTSKFRGRTLKRMSGICKKEDRKGDAKTWIR
jgi:hypothetical protein